jgi:peptidoglycan/LPS O-acetylase OafA/YrhL
MCVVILAVRCGVSWGAEVYEGYKPTHFRMDGLGLGVCAQLLWRERKLAPLLRFCTHRLTVTVGLIGVICCCLNYRRSDVLMFQWGYSFIAMTYACVLLMVMRRDEAQTPWGLCATSLAWVGRISYNTYLWHCMVAVILYPLWQGIDGLIPESGVLGHILMTGLYVVSSLLVGLLMTRTVESWCLRLRAKIDQRSQ